MHEQGWSCTLTHLMLIGAVSSHQLTNVSISFDAFKMQVESIYLYAIQDCFNTPSTIYSQLRNQASIAQRKRIWQIMKHGQSHRRGTVLKQ